MEYRKVKRELLESLTAYVRQMLSEKLKQQQESNYAYFMLVWLFVEDAICLEVFCLILSNCLDACKTLCQKTVKFTSYFNLGSNWQRTLLL